MSALVRSVNVGLPQEAAWAEIGRTSIDKRPVAGPVRVHRLGLGGDQVSDTRHHGGVDQAVYAFAREDLDRWRERLGTEIPDGWFGENSRRPASTSTRRGWASAGASGARWS